MKRKAPAAAAKASYELEWKFSDRLITEHLGCLKYSSSTKALRELVANSLDANATWIKIDLKHNELGEPEILIVADNGRGISPRVLRERFRLVGADSDGISHNLGRLGRFGVGRLAVHRIGTVSVWTTVSDSEEGRLRCTFKLTEKREPLKIDQEPVAADTPTGTTIEIFNLRDKDKEKLTPTAISGDLLSHYCSYLLANAGREIFVQGDRLNVDDLIARREPDSIPASAAVPGGAKLQHLFLHKPLDQSRFPAQMIFSAKGRTVAAAPLETPPSPNYLGIIECIHLDSMLTANRDLLIEMDKGFSELKKAALERIESYGERYRVERKHGFIQRARQQDYYPYRSASSDPVQGAKQALYDVVLEKVNDNANVEGMTKRQQEVVFRLLKRALENENVLEVLHEVAKLSDADFDKFRNLLERTTLDSILKLSSEVSHRLDFLDVLHKLIYGDVRKHLKERTQLHRILEPDCWVFGPQFHLAASDQSFREVVRQHRKKAGLPDVDDAAVVEINGVEDIPDLFLAATRDYPLMPKHHHVIVELKAPSVSLGRKEVEQVRRYADTILDSHEFEKINTRWDIFLVSGRCTGEIERDRKQEALPHGLLWRWTGMSVWAFEWSEIITRAREEMQLVKDHLQRKSSELTVSEYLRENFPDILNVLSGRLGSDLAPKAESPLSNQEGIGPA